MLYFMPFTNLFYILYNVLEILVLLLILEVILSWAMMLGARGISSRHPVVVALHRITDPVLAPFRRLWEAILNAVARSFRVRTMMLRSIDLSPLLAILAIQIVQSLLVSLAAGPRG